MRSALSVPLLLLGLIPVLTGCQHAVRFRDGAKAGPFYAPANAAGEAVLPGDLRRVVLLPVHTAGRLGDEAAGVLDAAVLAALQRQARFEVVSLPRELGRRWFGRAEFSSAAALPPDLLARLAAEYAADAVVFVDLTEYRTMRPLAVGFRAKLATLSDVRLLWSFDETISAGNPAVANRVRRDLGPADRAREPVDLSELYFLSPARFASFAAGAMFETLPLR